MDEEARLIIVTNGKDKAGFPVEQKEEIPVFVSEKSAVRTEFYEALRSDITIRKVLEMRQEDWELSAHMSGGKKAYASRIQYDGAEYEIIRTYKNDKSKIEVICS